MGIKLNIMNLMLNSKKFVTLAGVFFVSLSLFSCKSIKNSVLNGASDSLAGSNKKGVPVKVKADEPNPMDAFMDESDPVIVQEVLPTIVKLYEIMHIENPSHQGLSIMCGSLQVMYANLCIQSKADLMTDPRLLDEQVAEYKRAQLHYLKGRDYILGAFDQRWPGFKDAVLGTDAAKIEEFVSKLTADDVNAVYWACAGHMAFWSLDPLDPTALGSLKGSVAMLEKAAALDPDYGNGGIWDILSQFYTAAPIDFGGDAERGVYCHEQAMRASSGKSASVYVTYAEAFCKPAGDVDGFKDALNKALAIDASTAPSGRLMTVISQNKARWLLEHIDDYFVIW